MHFSDVSFSSNIFSYLLISGNNIAITLITSPSKSQTKPLNLF